VADLSNLTLEQLQELRKTAPAAKTPPTDLSKLSTEELLALQKQRKAEQAALPQDTERNVPNFIGNIGRDAYETAKGAASSVYQGGKKLLTDPVGAAGDVVSGVDTAGSILSGTLGHAWNDFANQPLLSINGQETIPNPASPITPGPDMEMAGNVGANLKDRYWDNLGTTLYEHPVQSAMDVGSLLAGGETLAARALSPGARMSKVLRAGATATNPVAWVNPIREGAAESRALRQMRKNAPTREQVAAETGKAYDELRAGGISVPADEFADVNANLARNGQVNASAAPRSHGLAQQMRAAQARGEADLAGDVTRAKAAQAQAERAARELQATGHPDAQHAASAAQNAAKATQAAEQRAAAGKSVFFDELDDFRQQAGAIARDYSPATTATERAGAQEVVKQIDNILNKTSGKPDIDRARELARRNILSREAEEMDRRSEFYPSGEESGIRNQYSSYGKRAGHSLTEQENKDVKKVIRREGVRGALTSAGARITQDIILGSGGAGIGALFGGGPVGGAIGTAVGLGTSAAARKASELLTDRAVQRYKKTVLAGREAQAEAKRRGTLRYRVPDKAVHAGAQAASAPTRIEQSRQERLARALLEKKK